MTFRERIDGLRWRLHATRRIWKRGAMPDMPLLEPVPMPDGRLDTPAAGQALPRGPLTVSGWVLFPSSTCLRVEIWLGGTLLDRARLGVPRVELSAGTGIAAAGLAGFELTTDFSEWPGPDGRTVLRAVALGVGGERHELSTPVIVAPAPEASEPDDEKMPPVVVRESAPGARRVLVFTHQLTLGGAQLYLLDLLRELTARGAVEATVLSTQDGPLRRELAALGVPSHVTSIPVVQSLSSHLGRIEELTAWADGRGFEAVFVNTATATVFPAIEVAARLGIPAVWAIHESLEPALLWSGLEPAVHRRAERTLSEASAVLFEADATRRLFEATAPDGHFLTVPYGLDLEPIDAARRELDRDAARRAAGVGDDAELVLCVGTVEPRKAQVSLTQAFELIAERHPHARLALVGGRDDDDARLLGEYIAASPHQERIELVPITPNVQRWYGMADLLVCASDVESLPRTVLEAMAWELPVLATDVYGLPELIDDGETGWLCAPRDVEALAAALDRALDSSAAERERMGREARALVERRHSLAEYGERVAALLDEVVEAGAASDTRHAAGA